MVISTDQRDELRDIIRRALAAAGIHTRMSVPLRPSEGSVFSITHQGHEYVVRVQRRRSAQRGKG